MRHRNENARVNVKLLVILILVTTAVGISLVAARQIRRSILSKMSLEAGEAAFAKGTTGRRPARICRSTSVEIPMMSRF